MEKLELEHQAMVLIEKAEQRYGPKDPAWTYQGIRFCPDGPNTWLTSEPFQFIWIELSATAATDHDQALFQIAHEVVHLLAPHRSPPTIMLEEGLAVKFSIEAPDFAWCGYSDTAREHVKNVPNYGEALDLAEQFLSMESGVIKRLRLINPSFPSWTPDFLSSYVLGLDPEFAAKLCERRGMR